jgi:lysophospholipase L1-like esterase
MVRILVFGASITYGAWDKEGGWVQRLRKFLDEKTLTDPNFYCIIYNLGISGDTTEDLLERFEFETKQRLKEEEKTIIIFAIGTNDSQFIHSQNSLRHSPQKFQNNLQKLVNLARKFSSKIIFVGLTPVDELKVDPIPWDTDKSYKNEYIQKYNEIIKSVCKKNKIYFIEILEKFVKLDYKDLLEDGLHPNSKGHQEIFEIVKDYLIQNKII